jgi:hypothetical protein
MDELLIELAKKADWQRFTPFPNKFRITTKENEPHTFDEFKKLLLHLNNIELYPELKSEITKTSTEMVLHTEKSETSNLEYEFKYPFIDKYILDKKYPERWYLFHGSNEKNWYSILHNGIKNMSGTALMTNGAAYGNGIYLSDDISMATSYGLSNKGKSYIAVVEILVDPKKYLKTKNIYVIPDETLLFVRYLYVIHKKSLISGNNCILSYYKKLRDSYLINKTNFKRLEKDIDKLSKLNHVTILDHDNLDNYYLIKYNQIEVRCYFHNYPFKPCVFQLCKKYDFTKIESKDDIVTKESIESIQYSYKINHILSNNVIECNYLDWSPMDNLNNSFIKYVIPIIDLILLYNLKELNNSDLIY